MVEYDRWNLIKFLKLKISFLLIFTVFGENNIEHNFLPGRQLTIPFIFYNFVPLVAPDFSVVILFNYLQDELRYEPIKKKLF